MSIRDELWSVTQVAEYLGRKPATVFDWIYKQRPGFPRSIRLSPGGKGPHFFRPKEIEAWARRCLARKT